MRYWTIHSTTATFRSPVSICASAIVSFDGWRVDGLGRRVSGPESELHLELPLHGHLRDPLHAERDLEVRPRLGRPHELPEALDDGHLVGLDLVVARHGEKKNGRGGQQRDRTAARKSRHSRERRELDPPAAAQVHRPSALVHFDSFRHRSSRVVLAPAERGSTRTEPMYTRAGPGPLKARAQLSFGPHSAASPLIQSEVHSSGSTARVSSKCRIASNCSGRRALK